MRTLQFSAGTKTIIEFGRLIAFRYEGVFHNPALAGMAETGLWYAQARGTGLDIRGEGETPEKAIENLKYRARATVTELQAVYGI